MKQEFITTHGNVVIERDKIYVLAPDPGSSERDIYFPAFIFLQIASVVFNVSEFKWVAIVFGILWMVSWISLLIKFKNQTFKSRIVIKDIKDIANEDDKDGLNTWVKLHLSSGKIRYIKFRKLENQYQPFIEAVSQQILIPQSVV